MDLRTSTWTYLQLWNEHGKIARFNFHGCSLVADAFKDPSILFVFGGREIIDVKTASKSKSITALKGIDCYTHIINIEDATITPVVAKNSPPSSRYGHIGITTVSVDSNSHPSHGIQMKYRKKKDKKSKKGGFLDMLTEMKIDRVMFVYGGSANESGGFCDPILYELDRVKSTGEPLTLFIDKQDEQSKIGGNQSVADMSGISGHYSSKFGGLSPTGSVYSQADVANTLDTRGSIWTSMQQQGGAKPDSVRQPSNWNELKLALSSPLSFRVTDSAESEVFNTRQGTSSSSRFGTRDSPRTIGSRLPTASLLDRVGTGYLPRNEGRLTHSAPLLQRASTSKIASRSNLLTAPISLRNSGIYNNSQKTMRAQTSPGFSRQFAGSRELSSAGALTMGEIGMEESHVMQEASIPLNHRDLTPKEIKRDKIKNISQSLKPVIKNKTKIEARDVYQQLYPFPSHMQPGKYW